MIEVATIKFILSSGGDKYIPYLSHSMFSSDIPKYMMEMINSHYEKHNKIPTLDDLKMGLYRKLTDAEDKKRIRRWIRNLKSTELSSEATQDLIEEIIQKSKLRGLFQNYIPQLDSLTPIDFEELRTEVEKIGNIRGVTSDEDRQPLLTMSRRVRDTTNSVPTFSDKLNSFLNPGLAPGELGLIQGNPGFGKTLFAINLTSGGARQGFRIWFVTLDEMGEDIADRFDEHLENFIVKDKIPKWVDNIEIIDFSDGRKVTDLDFMLERAEVKPHLVVVDGTDEFIDSSSKEVRHQIGNIYKSLRRISRNKKRPVGIWLTTQSTAASEGKLKKGMFDMGENKVVKAGEASVIISVNQTEEEYNSCMARLYISKIRRKKGKYKTIKIYYNPETQMLRDLRDDDDQDLSDISGTVGKSKLRKSKKK